MSCLTPHQKERQAVLTARHLQATWDCPPLFPWHPVARCGASCKCSFPG